MASDVLFVSSWGHGNITAIYPEPENGSPTALTEVLEDFR